MVGDFSSGEYEMIHSIDVAIRAMIKVMTQFEYEEYLAKRYDLVTDSNKISIVFHRQMMAWHKAGPSGPAFMLLKI